MERGPLLGILREMVGTELELDPDQPLSTADAHERAAALEGP